MKEINEFLVVGMYNSGVSELGVAKHFSVARGTIRRILTKYNTHIRNQSESEKLRWSQMSSEQRQHQIKAYHDKIRGSKKTYDFLVKRAKTVQAKRKLSSYEWLFYDAFKAADIPVIPAYAFGKFNIDFAIPEAKIAIEINGGNWHTSDKHQRGDDAKRLALKEAGWFLYTLETHRKKIDGLIASAIGEIGREFKSRSDYLTKS